jgi:uncharacterized membrane protein
MNKKSLVSKQVAIVLYLLAAAISLIEATVQYKLGGFSNWKLYLLVIVFFFSAIMYFVKKKQRFEEKKNN